MNITVSIEGKRYSIDYDDACVDNLLDRLGMAEGYCKTYVKKCVLYFSTGTRRLRSVYDVIASEHDRGVSTIVTHIRAGLERASNDGRLERVNDLFLGAVYDYSYGMTNKEFIAVVSSYLKMSGKIGVRLADGDCRG